MIKKQNQVFFTSLVLSDATMLVLAWICAFEIRFQLRFIPVFHGVPRIADYLYMLPVILAAFPIAAKMGGLYKPLGKRRLQAEVFYAWKTVTFLVIFTFFATFFLRAFSYSRVVAVYFWILGTVLVALSHAILWKVLIKFREKEEYLKETLIIGAGEQGRNLAQKIDFHPELGFLVMGFIAVGKENEGAASADGYPVLGGLDDLNRVIHRYGIDQVFITLPANLYGEIDRIIEKLSEEMVDIKVVPDFIQYMRLNSGIEEFEGMPIINLVASPIFGWNWIFKRWFDLAFSFMAIAALSPLLILVALIIKLTSRGPVFYRQERMGLDGRRFMMIKFRSMRIGAEKETGPVFSEKNDNRVTAVGGILRRFSLDELPQLFNVVKGEMSLVGPRPERPVFVEDFRKKIPRYMQRHKVKAGMTGWAQVNDWRGNTSIDKRIEYDLYYIEHWSPAFDLKILFQTVGRVFFSKHAY